MCCGTIQCGRKSNLLWFIRVLPVIILLGCGGLWYYTYTLNSEELLTMINFSIFEKETNAIDAVSMGMYAFIGILVLMSLWTCCVTRLRVKACLIPFGLLSFVMMVALAAMGFVLIFNGGIIKEDFLEQGCMYTNKGEFDQLSGIER